LRKAAVALVGMDQIIPTQRLSFIIGQDTFRDDAIGTGVARRSQSQREYSP